jgi:hypothetical protein
MSDWPKVEPHIVAEVVREILDADDHREASLAGLIAGPDSTIATRDELLADPAGRVALEAWDARDDTEYDRETKEILDDRGSDLKVPGLRAVGEDGRLKPRPRVADGRGGT